MLQDTAATKWKQRCDYCPTSDIAILVSCACFALSVALRSTADFGEHKPSRYIAIALAVLTGLPSFVVVLLIVGAQ